MLVGTCILAGVSGVHVGWYLHSHLCEWCVWVVCIKIICHWVCICSGVNVGRSFILTGVSGVNVGRYLHSHRCEWCAVKMRLLKGLNFSGSPILRCMLVYSERVFADGPRTGTENRIFCQWELFFTVWFWASTFDPCPPQKLQPKRVGQARVRKRYPSDSIRRKNITMTGFVSVGEGLVAVWLCQSQASNGPGLGPGIPALLPL